MANDKHHAITYEWYGSTDARLSDGNALYRAFLKSKSGSDWKRSVRKFAQNWLPNLAAMQDQIDAGSYRFHDVNQFVLHERGKTRPIESEQIEDRIVTHALCDEVLLPAIQPYLIWDNTVSQKGKGLGLARMRLKVHLQKYVRKYGTDGYILLYDFSGYYDHILHDVVMQQFAKYVGSQPALDLLAKILRRAAPDVSYMTDAEIAQAMSGIFRMLEHYKTDPRLLTGDRFLKKRVGLGNQAAQTIGIAYCIPLDNYIKIVRGVKYYGRYNDDSYIIHHDKRYLKSLLQEIESKAAQLGIHINHRKTKICPLRGPWTYLQIRYRITPTGKIIERINPKRLKAFRRKLKKLAKIMPRAEFENWYKGWMHNYARLLTKSQRRNNAKLYKALLKRYEENNG